MSEKPDSYDAYLKAANEFLVLQENICKKMFNSEQKLSYQTAYELQIQRKTLLMMILQYIDTLKKATKGNQAIVDDCNRAKEK